LADILGTLSSNYVAVGLAMSTPKAKYVNVSPSDYQGAWTGKYADNASFKISISDVSGFRAKAKYESRSTVKYQDVLINNKSFRIGDSKFILTRAGVAQVKTVVINPANGSTFLDTAYAHQQT
jgi:hypothetical protein